MWVMVFAFTPSTARPSALTASFSSSGRTEIAGSSTWMNFAPASASSIASSRIASARSMARASREG